MIVDMKDTIAAISTPKGDGGIGIVRISGPESQNIARTLFRPSKRTTSDNKCGVFKKEPHHFKPRRLYHGHIADPEKGCVVDEVLLVFMPAPNSYTGEDVVEIQAHAGNVVLKQLLELVLDAGARIAQPGEFTRRAYLMGRIDLSQAEAVMDVIQAKTQLSLNIATRNLEGAIGKTARRVKQKILDVTAMVEAQIEFPDDTEENDDPSEIIEKFEEILAILKGNIDAYKRGYIFREGMRLVIVGRANVGKSSLLNRFLKRDRAIVTEYPGTTRDSIEEIVNINGLPVILVDTAGLRDSNDPVERIGMDRTRKLSKKADLILFMMDAGAGVVPEDLRIYQEIRQKNKMLVINKTDLLESGQTIPLPKEWRFSETCFTSLKLDEGMEQLKEALFNFGTGGMKNSDNEIVPNMRQNVLFEAAHGAVASARRSLQDGMSLEIAAIDLKEAIETIDEITGEAVKTDVMNTVFSQFCIGK